MTEQAKPQKARPQESKPQQAETQWVVYLLRCVDKSLYCGITNNLEKRLRQHNGDLAGGAKYTKARQPCQLVYSEPSANRSHASQREHAIKQYSKVQKEALIITYKSNLL